MMAPTAAQRKPIDKTLFLCTLALVVIGLWMVFDAGYVKSLDTLAMQHDAFYSLRKQAVGAVFGFALMFLMFRVGYWKLRPFSVPLLSIGIVLLVVTLLYAAHHNGAARWIRIGPLQFQPSEPMKLFFSIYLADALARRGCPIRDFWGGLVRLVFVLFICCGLIEREPDLGTAAVLFAAAITQLFVGGARKKHLGIVLLFTGVLVAVAVAGFGHRGGRFEAWLHPERDTQGSGYHTMQARYAIGSGQLVGVGLGRGKGKYFLPESNTDFVLATYAEETGLVGTVSLMGVFLVLGWRGFRIACDTKDRFGSLLAVGISATISWQAILNIGVAIGVWPATGVPLPFISFGSTSLMVMLVSIGILMNIAQNPGGRAGSAIASRGALELEE